MSDKPIKIPRYIQLLVKEPLDKKQASAWMASAKAMAPSGVLATVQTTDEQGGLKGVSMVHKEGKKKHAYLIPLTRDLAPDEIQKIVDDFAAREPEMDFDIESNETRIEATERDSISVSDARHLAICTAMAKARHDKWMKERLNGGWRYGIGFDTEEKTHPLLRNWDQLPDQFRQPDLESPQSILDLMSAQGYAIIPRDELDRLVNKAKNI